MADDDDIYMTISFTLSLHVFCTKGCLQLISDSEMHFHSGHSFGRHNFSSPFYH